MNEPKKVNNDEWIVDREFLETTRANLAQGAEAIELLEGMTELVERTYWRLAVALGDVEEGQKSISMDLERTLSRVEEELWRIRDLDNS